MLDLSLDIYFDRLPRARCDECHRRRVRYRIRVMPSPSLPPGYWVCSLARCAKCLGIGK